MSSGSDSSDGTSGFRAKIFKSTQLSTLRFLSDVGLRLVSTVVLTRLLAPEIYGIFAVVLLYMYLLELFSDVGLRSLILTKENEVGDGFLRSCWSISILRGLLIALFSVGVAGAISLLQGQGAFAAESPYTAPVLPLAIVLAVAAVYAQYAGDAVVAGAFRGMGAVAAGLILGTALKLASALGSNPMGLRVCALAGIAVFIAVALLRLPLIWVLLVLGSLACVFAWTRLRAVTREGDQDDVTG